MPQPLSRAQQLENAAFLEHLRRTGNANAAADAMGFMRGRFLERRRKHPAFAVQWNAALTLAHAALERARAGALPVEPGAPRITFSSSGRRQLRRARRGQIDHAGRQRFLAALSASANVVLSAAAAGYSTNALYNHRRINPGFAREWRLALEMGYERLEMAMLASAAPESFADDQWRRNDPPAIPPMTANQALQLMYLHQKEVRLGGTPEPLRRRKGESQEARQVRLSLIHEARLARDREAFQIAEAERSARGEPTYIDWEAEGVTLPDLSQVTGWSKADPTKVQVDETRALFGGWRIEEMKARKRRDGKV